ncbi:hypothetical protein AAC387_Pa11g0238 [Persea americana]
MTPYHIAALANEEGRSQLILPKNWKQRLLLGFLRAMASHNKSAIGQKLKWDVLAG